MMATCNGYLPSVTHAFPFDSLLIISFHHFRYSTGETRSSSNWFCGLTLSGRTEARTLLSKKHIKCLSYMFYDYNNILKSHIMETLVKLFSMFQEELESTEISARQMTRDTPPASLPPCSCSWAVDA